VDKNKNWTVSPNRSLIVSQFMVEISDPSNFQAKSYVRLKSKHVKKFSKFFAISQNLLIGKIQNMAQNIAKDASSC
jgi:hypothetical protein